MVDLLGTLLFCALCIRTGLTERAVDGLGDGPPFTTADAQHLNYSIRVGYQVLLPGMKFNRYGNLTSWSALVVFHNDPNSGALHQTLFQIWRPTGSGRYKLVGFDEITVPADVIEPISTDSHENENLAYYVLNHREEDRTDDQEAHADKEENKPLYFKPGDIVGFLIQSFVQTANGQMYVTYHNQTASDPDHEVMDMFYITTDGSKGPCEINTCSEEIQLVKSVVPNIFFTYDELNSGHEVFQDEPDPSSTDDCILSVEQITECPTNEPSSQPVASTATTPTSSPTSHPTSSPTSPPTNPPPISSPQVNENLLIIIAVSAVGAVVILVLGGVLIVIVALVCKKKKNLRGGNSDSPREASNALYSEMNGVDEPTAYASTYRIKPGIYVEHETNMTNPSTPHFAIRTGDSVVSLSSHNGRAPFSISGPMPSSGPASYHRILTPSEMGAMSMQLPRSHRNRGSLTEEQRRSLRETSNGKHQRPPIPSAMQPQNQEGDHRRGSMPLKPNYHHELNPGKSMPTLSSSSQSSSPYPCPPTPQISDPPVPYLLPTKPWYKTDYEQTTTKTEKETPLIEERLYVPTMEERDGEDYSRLWQPHHSKGSNDDSAFFDGPDVFNEPASTTNEIYQQLSNWKAREIIRKYITLHDQIGSGHFATVCRGVWLRPGGEQEVAVKELKSGAEEEDRVKLLKEAAIMSQFNHTNVVKLHGIVSIDEPLLIVMELMPNGDLKNYLDRFTANRRSPRQRRSAGSTPPPSPGSLLPITPSLPHQLLSFCRQVADGMDYLSQKRFVHRDLATRNIFLTKDFTCKIGDFGLARDLGREELYQSTGGKIPVKWTAPEALQYRHFTSASDVWSYGMVLFEIWSLGHRPFDACPIEKDVMELIGSSVCQPPPPGCPREIYKLMTLCWKNKASNRPTFTFICEFLNQSDSNLLKLPAELPSTISPQATQLGAPLTEGRGLYQDLQGGYEESIV